MLKALKNLASSETYEVEPWTYKRSEISNFRNYKGDKSVFISWCKSPTTEHCFYSLHEGEVPSRRIDKSNPAYLCHGIVLDYDCTWEPGDEGFNRLKARLNAELPKDNHPNVVCRTFSGGWRLIWIFEEDVHVLEPKLHKKFLERSAKEYLKATRILPNLDDNSFNEGHYWELGEDWRVVNEKQLRGSLVWGWYATIAKDIKTVGRSKSPTVPIEIVSKWVNDDFPGRWKGRFELNSRGPRFWDPDSKDDTAALVKEDGILYFTDGGGFRTWRQIFGENKMKEFEADRIGKAIRNTWWDGTKYYVVKENSTEKDFYIEFAKQSDLKNHLEVNFHIAVEKYGEASEMQSALDSIHQYKKIEAAVPFVYRQKGVIHNNGDRVFNTSCLQATEPANDGDINKWPWIHRFITNFFVSEEQLDYFLAWLKRFYESSRAHKPLMGQVIYIAGPVQKGKTFLSNVLVSKLMGGSSPASEFLTGESGFNGSLLRYGLWTMDDQQALVDRKTYNHYSGTVKKLAANPTVLFNQKYHKTYPIDWKGRLIVTCNTDAESLRVLPDVDINLDDKIMIFKCGEPTEGLFSVDAHQKVDEELPFFARWLLSEWKPKDETIYQADGRYGIEAFKDKSLFEVAQQNSESHSFKELLDIFITERSQDWKGSATELLRELTMEGSSLATVARNLTSAMVGRRLHQLMNKGIGITQRLVREGTSVKREYHVPTTIVNS